jgi:hypothetical protein
MQTSIGNFQWHTINAKARFVQVGAPQTQHAPPKEDTGWSFDIRQWQALERLGWTNRLANLLPEWGYTDPIHLDTMDQVVRRAMDYGLREESDILRFAYCTLSIHPRFDAYPEIARDIHSLQEAAKQTRSFCQLSQQWPDTLIENVRSGQWLQMTNHHPNTTRTSS